MVLLKQQYPRTADLRNKILQGIDLAVERLIRKKQKEDGALVFS